MRREYQKRVTGIRPDGEEVVIEFGIDTSREWWKSELEMNTGIAMETVVDRGAKRNSVKIEHIGIVEVE